jgi:hypothetical protein
VSNIETVERGETKGNDGFTKKSNRDDFYAGDQMLIAYTEGVLQRSSRILTTKTL